MQEQLNKKYAAGQFFYYTLFATMFAFVSVFLLYKGFDNTTIGFTLSLTSIFSIIIQTVIANSIDRYKEIKIQQVLTGVVLAIIAGSTLLFLVDAPMLVLFLVVISYSLTQAMTPLLNALAFLYEPFGIHINYGLARGMGSLSYALITVLLGAVIERTSPNYLPLFYIGFAIILLFTVRSYELPEEYQVKPEIKIDPTNLVEKVEESEKSLSEFVTEYKKLVLLMSGVIFLFLGHSLINNFFIQVITPIGGNSRTMGIAIFIGTILELPAMMNFNWLVKKIPLHRLLQIAAVFFFAKHFLTFLAPNLGVIYFAQALQIGAFSVAYPALVEYTNVVVSAEDLVRGQSLLTIAVALSSVVSSFGGGILLDQIGVSATLLIAVVTTAIGVVIVFLAVEDYSQVQEEGVIQ